MDRKKFLQTLGLVPFIKPAMAMNSLSELANLPASEKEMPVLFLGHGNPMNAIEENQFVAGFRNMAKTIPHPKAVLCISAHWETKGTLVTAMERPKTIHDFGGFPKALFDVQYPAPGSPAFAKELQSSIHGTSIGLNQDWGLDHGCWTVLKHFFPKADVPVVQMSLDYSQGPKYHYELAKELAALRKKGVLIVGSGNMVHNLGMVAWDKMNADDYAYDWAREASNKMKSLIHSGDHAGLINYASQGKAFQMSIPSPDHFLPLLYILALQGKNEQPVIFNDKAVAGSLTMTSVKFG